MPLLKATVVLIFSVIGLTAVTFPKNNKIDKDDDSMAFCLRAGDPLIPCLTSGAVKTLESAQTELKIDLGDGLSLITDHVDDKIPIGDPREARTLLDTFGFYMEQRYLHWDMQELFPGLVMRVGPTSRGYLQFLLDKRRVVDDRSLSTGRLILKRTLLPVLLGVKFNVASLVPLLVAGLIIIIKKSLVLSKFSIILSALAFFYKRGFNGVSNNQNQFNPDTFGPGLGSFANPPKHSYETFDQNYWLAREEI